MLLVGYDGDLAALGMTSLTSCKTGESPETHRSSFSQVQRDVRLELFDRAQRLQGAAGVRCSQRDYVGVGICLDPGR